MGRFLRVYSVSEEFLEIARGQNLNSQQLKAMVTAEVAKDYALFLGMPGTGKTATIASLMLATAARGQTILLCGHTHASVDNVLLRLVSLGMKSFIRVGHASQVSPLSRTRE